MQRTIAIVWCSVILGFAAVPVTAREKIASAYEAGHFFATSTTSEGQHLRLVVDSGGGGGGGAGRFIISRKTVTREKLEPRDCALGGGTTPVVDLPASHWNGLPVVEERGCDATALVLEHYEGVDDEDGNLGAGYLPHFTWTFDYPGKALWLEDHTWKPGADMRKVALGFMEDSAGAKSTGFPRVTLTIAGQSLDFLLDTGATAKPTPAGLEASGIETMRGIGVTSYITTSVLERWHREHPTWRLVDNGDALMGGMRIIEVPFVEIAGWAIGPIWFTERPDRAFGLRGISQWMDTEVVGAAGANLWQHFVMTLDYPHDTAWLRCANCEDASR